MGGAVCFTYESARKEAVILRTSMSLSEVSSNPGVSMRTTGRPSRRKGSVAWTVFVKDRSPSPIPKLDLLMRLMNCLNHGGVGDQTDSLAFELKRNVR